MTVPKWAPTPRDPLTDEELESVLSEMKAQGLLDIDLVIEMRKLSDAPKETA